MQIDYAFDPIGLNTGVRADSRAVVAANVALDEGAHTAPFRCPDWLSLRARFQASHALRQALTRDSVLPSACGSFTQAGRSVLFACRADPPVNLLHLANIKGPCAINDSVAALPTRGDRGLL